MLLYGRSKSISMKNLKAVIKQFNDNSLVGHLELNKNIIKGIVASGDTKEEIIEQLELLYDVKLKFDQNRKANSTIVEPCTRCGSNQMIYMGTVFLDKTIFQFNCPKCGHVEFQSTSTNVIDKTLLNII